MNQQLKQPQNQAFIQLLSALKQGSDAIKDQDSSKYTSPTRLTFLNSANQSTSISPDKPFLDTSSSKENFDLNNMMQSIQQQRGIHQLKSNEESNKILGKRLQPHVLIENFNDHSREPAIQSSNIMQQQNKRHLIDESQLVQSQSGQPYKQFPTNLQPQYTEQGLTPFAISQILKSTQNHDSFGQALNNDQYHYINNQILRQYLPQIMQLQNNELHSAQLQNLWQAKPVENRVLQANQKEENKAENTVQYSNEELNIAQQLTNQKQNPIKISDLPPNFLEFNSKKFSGLSLNLDVKLPLYDSQEDYFQKCIGIINNNKKLLQQFDQVQQERDQALDDMRNLQELIQHIEESNYEVFNNDNEIDVTETNQKEEAKSMIAPSDSHNLTKQRSMNNTNMTLQSQDIIERYSSGRKKHLRRCANEIEKSYKCPYDGCEKFYGSEGSLNLHMKIKHNAGSKTEREKTAKQLVYALQNGMDVPASINLPPGTIEKTASQLGVELAAAANQSATHAKNPSRHAQSDIFSQQVQSISPPLNLQEAQQLRLFKQNPTPLRFTPLPQDIQSQDNLMGMSQHSSKEKGKDNKKIQLTKTK